jgi:hypothetical protein
MKNPTTDAISASSSSSKTLVAEPTDEVIENKELDDGLWEEDDNGEEENSVLTSACETASSATMDIEVDDGVDIGIPQLRDYLSDHPTSSPLVNVGEGLTVTKKASDSNIPRVFEVPDIIF